MAALCILYFVAISSCLSAVGLLVEQALPATAPRRRVWFAVIAFSLFIPPFISMNHSSAAPLVWANEVLGLPTNPAAKAASGKMVDRNWLDCGGEYGHRFNNLWLLSSTVLILWGVANARRYPKRQVSHENVAAMEIEIPSSMACPWSSPIPSVPPLSGSGARVCCSPNGYSPYQA